MTTYKKTSALPFPTNKVLNSVVAALCALSAPVAFAQQDTSDELERIEVTAQKRVQSINDVPASISAFEGSRLDELGLNELDMISDLTPGLVIQEQSPNNPGFVIRGITSDSGSAQASPRVSVYYNGVDVSRSRGSYFELFDIERVEVVKGPQATLFGTAASVGAISVITRKPEPGFSAELSAGAGNESQKRLGGFINGGSELVSGRLAFSYRERDGFIENIAPGQDDMNGVDRQALRGSLRFQPSDVVTADLIYSYEKNEDTGTSFKNGIFAPTGGDTSPYSFVEMTGSPYSASVLGREKLGLDRTVDDINLTVDWTISPRLSFTSVSGYRSFDSLEVFDADGTQAWFLEFGEDAEGDQFSQEFRFNYAGDNLLMLWGINYFTEDGSQRVPFSTEESIFLNCAGALPSGLPCINADGSVNQLTPVLTGGALQEIPYAGEFTNFGDNESWSAFVDFTYQLNDKTEVAAGIRYVSEDRESGFAATMPNSQLLPLLGLPTQTLLPTVSTDGEVFSASNSSDAWLPRFNILYKLNDNNNWFATISKGRRSEVVDVSSTLDADGEAVGDFGLIPAEVIWNYETGLKGNLTENRVRYSASVFYQDYSDFQVTLQDDSGNFYTANAGSATNFGVETEINANLGAGIELFGHLAYLDAKIDDDSTNGSLAGNRFRLQPEWTSSLGVIYEAALSSQYAVRGSVVGTYRSEVFFEPENAPVAGLDISQDTVSLVNASLGLYNDSANWSLALKATNLLDKEYLVDAGNTGGSFGNPTFISGPPRLFYLEFTKKFGM
ncbi:MAG: TonB-dependent receptor [Idiomarina loihiensis]